MIPDYLTKHLELLNLVVKSYDFETGELNSDDLEKLIDTEFKIPYINLIKQTQIVLHERTFPSRQGVSILNGNFRQILQKTRSLGIKAMQKYEITYWDKYQIELSIK
jgi:hypothetical protein